MALAESGADLNATTADGRTRPDGQNTALMLCVHRGYEFGVKALLQAGADADVADCSQCTPLCHASAFGDARLGNSMVRTLLAAGAAVDKHGYKGWTALHYAAYKDNAATVRALVAAGAPLDVRWP